jgi:O-antigen/teichoic acid export membrane protein
LSIRLADATWPWVRRIFTYGTKTSAGILQELLIHQFARLALALSAGPAAVASYSRYATVIRQIGRSVERVTQVIPPMTSGLVGLGREGDVAHFSLRASNAAVMMMLPMIVVFGALGDQLVAVWMGPEFVIPGLSWVFAAMAMVHADRGVTTQILSGLNSHGRISLICLFTSLALLLVLGVMLFPLDPLTTGVLVAASTVGGVTVPHFLIACQRLGIRPSRHFREVYLKPLICNAIFLVFLLGAENQVARADYVSAALTAVAGGVVLASLYWFVAFDERLRTLVRHRLAAFGHG